MPPLAAVNCRAISSRLLSPANPSSTLALNNVPADFHYFGWVDQHDVLGLGQDNPVATGSNSDALLYLDVDTGEWTTLRVPYPMGFYSRGLDGRIDDPVPTPPMDLSIKTTSPVKLCGRELQEVNLPDEP